MRSQFDEQLALLNRDLILMGALCEKAISMVIQSLVEGNKTIAQDILELSSDIKQKERDIETLCMRLLLQQQPVAKDLRVVSSALKMVTDMERIGVNAGDIAEMITEVDLSTFNSINRIQDMAQATIKMVKESVDAFVKRDIQLAKDVILYDDVVDNYFNEIKHMLILQFEDLDADGEKVLDALMIAKYFERMADHATEIAKWVLFSMTGHKKG